MMNSEKKCDRCEGIINGDYYIAPSNRGRLHLLCFLVNVRLFRRSMFASIIVGTILLLLNQGDFILSGNFYKAMAENSADLHSAVFSCYLERCCELQG